MVQPMTEGGNKYTPEVILITGGAGFIASHLVIRLVNNFPHYKVRCCRLYARSCRSRQASPTSLRWSMCAYLGVTVAHRISLEIDRFEHHGPPVACWL